MQKKFFLVPFLGLSLAAASAVYAMNHGSMMENQNGHMATQSPMKMDHGSMHMSPMHQELFAGMQKMHDDMHKGMMLKDADAAFAAGMIPHHEGAIVMAQVQLKYGKDPEMRALAEKIIAAQDPEIQQMSAWLEKHSEKAKEVESNHNAPMQMELMSGMQAMHDDMHQGMMHQDPDVAFAAGMIPHHEGAIAMAQVQVKYGKDPEMLALAKQIIAAQGPEIEQMKAWLAKKGYATSSQHGTHH